MEKIKNIKVLVFVMVLAAVFPAQAAFVIRGTTGGGGGGGSTFLSDNFTEASATPLEDHLPGTGTYWAGDAIHATVDAGGGYVTAEDDTARYDPANNATPPDNSYYVEVSGDLNGSSGNNSEIGAVARWNGSGTTKQGYQCKIKDDGLAYLRLYDGAGSYSELDGGGVAITDFDSNTEYAVRLSVLGNAYTDISCTVKASGVTKASIAATSHTVHTTTSYAGIHLNKTLARITSVVAVNP